MPSGSYPARVSDANFVIVRERSVSTVTRKTAIGSLEARNYLREKKLLAENDCEWIFDGAEV
jgi:hypothetical protein